MRHLNLSPAQLLADLEALVHGPFQVPLETSAKVPEHGGPPGQNHVLHGEDGEEDGEEDEEEAIEGGEEEMKGQKMGGRRRGEGGDRGVRACC